jgi:hypothetical protein
MDGVATTSSGWVHTVLACTDVETSSEEIRFRGKKDARSGKHGDFFF